MGLFSSSKKTYVSSVVYNLAGDINTRPNFLRTVIAGSILQGDKALGQAIPENYINGPAIRLRNFAQWAVSSGYNTAIGLSTVKLVSDQNIDLSLVAQAIPHAVGETVNITDAEIDVADYSFWAEQWITVNYPALLDTAWSAEFNATNNLITITFADATTASFTATNYDPYGEYLYAVYTLQKSNTTGPITIGPTITLPAGEAFPPSTGWRRTAFATELVTLPHTNTVHIAVTHSDARPDSSLTQEFPVTTSYVDETSTYERIVPMGSSTTGPARVYSIKETMHRNQVGNISFGSVETVTTNVLEGGVIQTVTTTTTTGSVVLTRSHQTDTQELIHDSWSGLKILIYRKGSGNAQLDTVFSPSSWTGNLFPFIPVRLNNSFLSETNRASVYALNKKAFKKATKSRYTNLIESLSDNESLGDIDHAFIQFGVSLNTKEMACRRYLYKFFKQIMLSVAGSSTAYAIWKQQMAAVQANNARVEAWENSNDDDRSYAQRTNRPILQAYPPIPVTSLKAGSTEAWTNYNINIKWNSIREVAGNGLGRAGAKRGDSWFVVGVAENYSYQYPTTGSGDGDGPRQKITINHSITPVSLYIQETATSWKRLDIHGLHHTNIVYNGKSVEISAAEALADTEESGFIIPLHDATYRAVGMKDSTQMSTACSYVVLNCYQVVKQKWYQSGFFQLFVIVIAITISIMFPPAGGAAMSGGILGTNVAIGAALGFAGTTALIVGAVANALAAMILTKIITATATAVLGDKIGAIVGAIASFAAMQVGTAMQSGQSMSQVFNQLSRADNLLKLTMTGVDGVAAYMQADIQDIITETAKVMEDYSVAAAKITEMYSENLGNTGIALDPMRMTQATLQYAQESPNSFFSRTLMTGSDIAAISHNLIKNFSSLTLDINLQS